MKLTELLFCSAIVAGAPLVSACDNAEATIALKTPTAPKMELYKPTMDELSANFDLDEISKGIVQDLKVKLVASNPLAYASNPVLKPGVSVALLKDKVEPGVSESTDKKPTRASATSTSPKGNVDNTLPSLITNR